MTMLEALNAAIERFREIADECEAVGQYDSVTYARQVYSRLEDLRDSIQPDSQHCS